MTLTDAGEYLVAECRSRRLSPQTIRFYQTQLRAIARIIGNPNISDITVLDLRRTISEGSEASAHHNYRTLKRLFTLLLADELITVNPMKKLKPPKLSKKVIDPLSHDDMAKILRAARQDRGFLGIRDAAIFATLVSTGIRAAELCSLKDDDVRLETGFLFINGKGRKQRLVPIPSKLRLLLARWLLVRKSSIVADKNDAFFKGKHGAALDTRVLGRIIERLGKLAGVRLHAHKCRHTFATSFMAEDGADILSLQAICGWEDLQMANRYAKAQLPKLQRSMEAFSPINKL